MIFILAAAGSAVGLGNVWKFPYITGENGGGAFVLVYLACIAMIGIPIMMAEILLGRRGRQSPINTMRSLAAEEGAIAERRDRHWLVEQLSARANGIFRNLGWLGVITGFLILSFYSVIAGWALSYVFYTAGGLFSGASADAVEGIFTGLVSDPERLIAWHTIFMVMTAIIVSRGVAGGLEKAIRYLMPGLFVLLLIMVGYAMSTGHFGEGLDFLFAVDFSSLDQDSVLVAMGHAFFTLSLGMGAIMIYGSYLPADASIARSTLAIAIMDTVVALLAGMAIFPIVFANGLEPGAGPGLIFQTLPLAFGAMPGGVFFGTLFFILLTFAALSSAISLIEPAVTWLVENRGVSRVKASVWVAVAIWLLGLGTVFSFNLASELTVFGKTFFDLLDYLTANILLPLGGLLIALFAGWQMSRQSSVEELDMGRMYNVWRILVRFVAPVGVVIVFLNAIGVLG